MPLQPIQFARAADIKHFLIKHINSDAIHVAIRGDYQSFSKIDPEDLRRQFIVAMDNNTYLAAELFHPNMKEVRFKLKTGISISLEELRARLKDPKQRDGTLALLEKDPALTTEIEKLINQFTTQEGNLSKGEIQAKVKDLIRDKHQEVIYNSETQQKRSVLSIVNLATQQYLEPSDETFVYKFIVDTQGDTYFIDDIKRMSDDEANQSSISFLQKDGGKLTLNELKQGLNESDAIMYQLIHNKPLVETLLAIKPEALEKNSKLPLRLKLPICPIMGKFLPVLNPAITFREMAYEMYALDDWMSKKMHPESPTVEPQDENSLTHPGSNFLLTRQEITPNNALQQLIILHMKEMLDKRREITENLNQFSSSSQRGERLGKVKQTIDFELSLYQASLESCLNFQKDILKRIQRESNLNLNPIIESLSRAVNELEDNQITLAQLNQEANANITNSNELEQVQLKNRARLNRVELFDYLIDGFTPWKIYGGIALGIIGMIGITLVTGGIVPMVVWAGVMGVGAVSYLGLIAARSITLKLVDNDKINNRYWSYYHALNTIETSQDMIERLTIQKETLSQLFKELVNHLEAQGDLNLFTELLLPLELERQLQLDHKRAIALENIAAAKNKVLEEAREKGKSHPADLIRFDESAPGLFSNSSSTSSVSTAVHHKDEEEILEKRPGKPNA